MLTHLSPDLLIEVKLIAEGDRSKLTRTVYACERLQNKCDSVSMSMTYAPNSQHCTDCIAGMKTIPSDSVQIIIADPPYNIGKDFGNDSDKQGQDNYLEWCDTWIAECLRVLKPDGTLYIFGFSETLAYIRTRLTCRVRWLVWSYTNRVKPTLNFWQRSHESILACWKKNVPHFNRDAVREPYTPDFVDNVAGRKRPRTAGRFNKGGTGPVTTFTAHPNGALPRDVIKVPALTGAYGRAERTCGSHPTQKPVELCLRLLKAARKSETDIVVVPFSGGGSELVACKMLGLAFVAFEINPEYVEIARKRLETTAVVAT